MKSSLVLLISFTSLIMFVSSMIGASVEDYKEDGCDTEFYRGYPCNYTERRCMPLFFICDGYRDCRDNSDEEMCMEFYNRNYTRADYEDVGTIGYKHLMDLEKLNNSLNSAMENNPNSLNEQYFRKQLRPCAKFVCPEEYKYTCIAFSDFTKEVNVTKQKYEEMKLFLIPIQGRINKTVKEIIKWDYKLRIITNLTATNRLCDGNKCSTLKLYDIGQMEEAIPFIDLRASIFYADIKKTISQIRKELIDVVNKLDRVEEIMNLKAYPWSQDFLHVMDMRLENMC